MPARRPLDPDVCQELVQSDRWLSKIMEDTGSGCWLWTATLNSGGYGQFTWQHRMLSAHRVALVARLGRDIGAGMEVSHDCHDRAAIAGTCTPIGGASCSHRRCVNPDHLSEKTTRDNAAGSPNTIVGSALRRTHCPRGHLLSGDNLYSGDLAKGWRSCVTCRKQNAHDAYRLLIEAAKHLGISGSAFVASYGRSSRVARQILAEARSSS